MTWSNVIDCACKLFHLYRQVSSCQSQHRIHVSKMSHFKINSVSASVVLYLSGPLHELSPNFVHLLLVKSRSTCIIVILNKSESAGQLQKWNFFATDCFMYFYSFWSLDWQTLEKNCKQFRACLQFFLVINTYSFLGFTVFFLIIYCSWWIILFKYLFLLLFIIGHKIVRMFVANNLRTIFYKGLSW